MKIGDIVWVVQEDNSEILEPTARKVAWIWEDGTFDASPGNSSGRTRVLAKEFHPTEAAAWLAYRSAVYSRIKDLGEQVTATLDAIREAEERIDELNTTEAPK
jgi:hypothetical protein